MIVDLILDRKDGAPYDPDTFHFSVTQYGNVGHDITYAFTHGTSDTVAKRLCEYVIDNGYNPDICDYINSVSWL
jgi:hypothetical protein